MLDRSGWPFYSDRELPVAVSLGLNLSRFSGGKIKILNASNFLLFL